MKKLSLAMKVIGGVVIVAVQEEFVERIESWRHSGFDAFDGEEVPDIAASLQVGLFVAAAPQYQTNLLTS